MVALRKAAFTGKLERRETGVRQHARYRLMLGAEAALGEDSARAVIVHDVSVDGLLIEAETKIAKGAEVAIAFPAIGTVLAEVVRTNGKQIGCVFRRQLSPDMLKALLAAAPVVWLPDGGTVADRGLGMSRRMYHLSQSVHRSSPARYLRAATGSAYLLWAVTILGAIALVI